MFKIQINNVTYIEKEKLLYTAAKKSKTDDILKANVHAKGVLMK
jgi:hypothetical protein